VRRPFSLALLAVGATVVGAARPAALAAQSSEFGVRGIGLPGRGLSTAAMATGGSGALFDPLSSTSPAALAGLPMLTVSFTGLQNYRSSDNPAGSLSGRDTHFPQTVFAGPLRRIPLVLGASYSSYAVRDFAVGIADTVMLRGIPTPRFDTVLSRGGVGDIGLSAAYRLSPGIAVGAAFHALTGVNRLRHNQVFADTTYLPVRQRAEVSYAGVGVAVGATATWRTFAVSLLARTDGRLRIERDSTLVSRVDLPSTLAAGLRWRARPRLDLSAQGTFRSWRDANRQLLQQGAAGSDNTVDLAFGGQFLSRPRDPQHGPLRFGARYTTLPFLVNAGEQPKEIGVSLGTGLGLVRDQDRGINRVGIDLSVEHVWRSAGDDYRERAFLVGLGVSIRP
jgi:hypothetical protein